MRAFPDTLITALTPANSSGVSVADQVAFGALPDETRALVHKLFGDVYTVGHTREEMKHAFEAGFDLACDADDPHYPYMSSKDFDIYMKER